MNLPKHIEEPQEPYNQIDHTHCFTHNNPPCGQKIKHFECCLCQKLNPEIAQILEEERKEAIIDFINRLENQFPNIRQYIEDYKLIEAQNRQRKSNYP